jgi:hypothetical protein
MWIGGIISEENVEVYYGHQVFQQPKEEKLRKQDPLGFKASGTEEH